MGRKYDGQPLEGLAARYKELEEDPRNYTLGIIQSHVLSEMHELETHIHGRIGTKERDRIFSEAEKIRRMVFGPKPNFRKWKM